ncbi:MAG: hypothetical protein NTV89_00280 [Proteobacteria bacterium]|nr:hypothetical protein [Pseudomonadota bacterium]
MTFTAIFPVSDLSKRRRDSSQFGWRGLYEIVPGFALAVIAIVAVRLLDKEPSEDIRQDFELSRL